MAPALNRLSRRHVLEAAGFSIGLPLLLSVDDLPFLRACSADQPMEQPVARFCCIFFPNGVSLPPQEHPAHKQWHWFPHSEGTNYAFTKSLAPLEKLRDELTILSGLSHPSLRGAIAHITADSFLTGADSSRYYQNSISLDQLIARHIGNQTRFPSLTLSSDGGVGTPGRTQTLSFSPSGRPIPSLSSPRAIFNRLFGVQHRSLAEQRRAFGRDRSILDNLLEETQTLKKTLSTADRDQLAQYTQSVREVELRMASADKWIDAQLPAVNEDDLNLEATAGGDAEEYIRAILDLIYLAILTDSTRTITYQVTSEDAKGIGDRFPTSIGLKGHHALSHGVGNADGYENWARYDQFLCSQLAYLIEKLRGTRDPLQPEQSLLETTTVLYGCSTSRTHAAVNYPLVLAGGRRFGLRHGAHRRFDENRFRMSDLYVTLLQQMGLEIDQFADSTCTLSSIIA